MEYASIILGVLALLAAGLAYWNTRTANRSLAARIDRLKEKNNNLERRLNELKSAVGRSNSQPSSSSRPARPVQEKPQQPQQPQPRQQQASPRGEPSQPGQPRKPKENRQREPQPQPSRQREPKPPREGEQHPAPRQPQAIVGETRGGERVAQPNPQAEQQRGKRFAIIPEDGIIRQHQLQHQPDSDSYLEVDMPADGSSNLTRYRFNLAGNHAFVIAQGIDRLENAFAFEKPANRQVSEVVLKGDGVLARDGNGWKIQEKAQIDFR